MSRDSILSRIDRATSALTPERITAEAAELISEPDEFRATFDADAFVRFREKATSETVTATIEEIANLDDLPMVVAQYMRKNNLGRQLALQPRNSLMALDWSGLEATERAQMNETLAVTIADAAIAETGSLVFRTGPDAPVLLNFLPLHHLAVVIKSTILAHMEDVFDRFGVDPASQHRSLNIITGTSGTADIEARNVRGAHGPRFMHIYCVEG